ncbi:hypothetical protein HOC80_04195 [archaeon]|jgi:hypothetical protein|nr:hypothetical protein [archaeon]MBT4417275.1 hypothetical protein [archaeon]
MDLGGYVAILVLAAIGVAIFFILKWIGGGALKGAKGVGGGVKWLANSGKDLLKTSMKIKGRTGSIQEKSKSNISLLGELGNIAQSVKKGEADPKEIDKHLEQVSENSQKQSNDINETINIEVNDVATIEAMQARAGQLEEEINQVEEEEKAAGGEEDIAVDEQLKQRVSKLNTDLGDLKSLKENRHGELVALQTSLATINEEIKNIQAERKQTQSVFENERKNFDHLFLERKKWKKNKLAEIQKKITAVSQGEQNSATQQYLSTLQNELALVESFVGDSQAENSEELFNKEANMNPTLCNQFMESYKTFISARENLSNVKGNFELLVQQETDVKTKIDAVIGITGELQQAGEKIVEELKLLEAKGSQVVELVNARKKAKQAVKNEEKFKEAAEEIAKAA